MEIFVMHAVHLVQSLNCTHDLQWCNIIIVHLSMFVDSSVPDTMPKDCITDNTSSIQLCIKGWLDVCS